MTEERSFVMLVVERSEQSKVRLLHQDYSADYLQCGE